MKKIYFLIALAITGYMLSGAYLMLFQRDFLYHPTAKVTHDFPIEQFVCGDATVDVIVLNGDQPRAVLYFGGNAEAVAMNAGAFERNFADRTLYLVNYRAYGGSSGVPSERALYADAERIFDAITARHSEVSVIGRSLGTGVATYIASVREAAKLVLVTPFDSVEHIAQDRYPIFPIRWMLEDRFDSFGRVGDISEKTLIILAEHDMTVPLKYSKRLIDAFPPGQLIVKNVEGVDHGTLLDTQTYYRLISSFYRSAITADSF